MKQKILDALQALPEDARIEDAMETLYLLWKIEQRLERADCGELIDADEVRRRMAKWIE